MVTNLFKMSNPSNPPDDDSNNKLCIWSTWSYDRSISSDKADVHLYDKIISAVYLYHTQSMAEPRYKINRRESDSLSLRCVCEPGRVTALEETRKCSFYLQASTSLKNGTVCIKECNLSHTCKVI